jgi:hypothetical protein
MDPVSNDETVLDALNLNFMAGYTSGYQAGLDRGRQLEAADMARLHAVAYRAVQASARLDTHAVHWAKVRARQVASCEAQKQDRVPWPDEVSL